MSISGCRSNVNVYSHSFVSEGEFYLWMQLCDICSGVFLWFRKNTVGKKNFAPQNMFTSRIEKYRRKNCEELCEVAGVSGSVILHKCSQ